MRVRPMGGWALESIHCAPVLRFESTAKPVGMSDMGETRRIGKLVLDTAVPPT